LIEDDAVCWGSPWFEFFELGSWNDSVIAVRLANEILLTRRLNTRL